jgi:hypothetical protein
MISCVLRAMTQIYLDLRYHAIKKRVFILLILIWSNLKPGYLIGIALGYGPDDPGFESRQGLGIFLFTIASKPALGPTQPPIQWVPGDLSQGVKRLGREADHTSPSIAEVKNAWSYTSTPLYTSMAWCSVKRKHRDKFTLPYHNYVYHKN